jgi:CRP-like cAMP-binding protein
MYVIQSGKARVVRQEGGSEVVVGDLKAGDLFGEMAIFEKEPFGDGGVCRGVTSPHA